MKRLSDGKSMSKDFSISKIERVALQAGLNHTPLQTPRINVKWADRYNMKLLQVIGKTSRAISYVVVRCGTVSGPDAPFLIFLDLMLSVFIFPLHSLYLVSKTQHGKQVGRFRNYEQDWYHGNARELSKIFFHKKDVKIRLADFGIIGRLKYIVTLELMRIEKSISCDSQCRSIHCLFLGLGE